MIFSEKTFVDALGGIVIQSKLGPAVKRSGFEKVLFPGVEVGLSGWERAHSQGAGTGFESPKAIRYAPQEVNQEYQRLGIERYLRDLAKYKNTELWLTTVTYTHPRSLRLKEIQYRVDEVLNGFSRRLFEASIEIENKTEKPRVVINATPLLIY